jgi:hypothetical protein
VGGVAGVAAPVDVAKVEALISALDPAELEEAFAAEVAATDPAPPVVEEAETPAVTEDAPAGGLSVVPDLTEEPYEGTGTEE